MTPQGGSCFVSVRLLRFQELHQMPGCLLRALFCHTLNDILGWNVMPQSSWLWDPFSKSEHGWDTEQNQRLLQYQLRTENCLLLRQPRLRSIQWFPEKWSEVSLKVFLRCQWIWTNIDLALEQPKPHRADCHLRSKHCNGIVGWSTCLSFQGRPIPHTDTNGLHFVAKFGTIWS